jgi:GNAT superfamily N-acetyltransferase
MMPSEPLPPLPPLAAYIFTALAFLFFLALCFALQRKLSTKSKRYPGLLLPAFLFLGSLLRFYTLYIKGEVYEGILSLIIPNLATFYFIKVYMEERRKSKMEIEDIRFITLDSDEDLHSLFIKGGLEVGNEPIPSKFMRVLAFKEEEDYLAGASLGKRGEYLVVDSITVDERLRGRGIGQKLMKELLFDLPYEKDLYLMAKAPDFFKKLGFELIPMEECPPVFGCLNCDRLGVNCFPKPMILRRGKNLTIQD